MKTYRIWFDNGSAVLVNAGSQEEAEDQALENADAAGYQGLTIAQVEQLD